MFLPKDRIASALAAWIEREMIPHTNGLEKLLAYAAAISLAKRGEHVVESMSPALNLLGLLDGDGRVDIDAARDLAREAFEKTGKIHALGFVFDAEDVDSLAAIAETLAA